VIASRADFSVFSGANWCTGATGVTRAGSVGIVHPIERLRHVARAGDVDPVLLAQEAAEALGSLTYEAQALVPACRRLIEAHPSCGPLWWVAAKVIVADEPFDAAYAAIEALADDPTAEELAASFPAGASVVIPAKAGLAAALNLRPDLSVTVVGMPYRLNEVLRRLSRVADVIGIDARDFDVEGAEMMGDGPHLLVLEALAAGPSGFLVDRDQAVLATAASIADMPCWVTTGVGRVLPAELFAEILDRTVSTDAMARAGFDLEDDEDDDFALLRGTGGVRSSRHQRPVAFLEAERVAAVVGPRGRAVPQLALRRAECRAPSELLGFARQQ
jgi:hypothetical protein